VLSEHTKEMLRIADADITDAAKAMWAAHWAAAIAEATGGTAAVQSTGGSAAGSSSSGGSSSSSSTGRLERHTIEEMLHAAAEQEQFRLILLFISKVDIDEETKRRWMNFWKHCPRS
jgi:hypothetical protein